MNLKKLSLNTTILLLAFILGLMLRFWNLGDAPLTESEASWALQALQISQPNNDHAILGFGSQPAYVMLTGLFFQLFSASNFTARVWSALCGSAIILLPLLLKRKLGSWGAMLLAFGLALDPGLVAVSREAGSPIMALAFTLLAAGVLLSSKKFIPAGILSGLALLSGSAIITGLLGIGVSLFVLRRSLFANFATGESEEVVPQDDSEDSDPEKQALAEKKENLRRFLLATLLTILVVGTLFFRYPQGLSAWFATIPDYLAGWLQSSGIGGIQILLSLLVYQPLATIFALIAILSALLAWRKGNPSPSKLFQFSIVWAGFSLFFALVYPSRQVSDLSWTLIPIWILAAYKLKEYLPDGELSWIALLESGLILLLAILFWNTLISSNRLTLDPNISWSVIRLAVLAGILALGALTTILIGLGWSWKAAYTGLVWGSVVVFSLYNFSSLWRAAYIQPNQPAEMWRTPPGTGQSALFESTLTDLSNWTTGFPYTLSVVSSVETPSLKWLLRDFKDVRYTSQPTLMDLPEVIITRQSQEFPEISTSYRGQDFVWWVYPGWQSIIPTPFFEWITFRKAPQVNESIILWARSDIFSGGVLESTDEFLESD